MKFALALVFFVCIGLSFQAPKNGLGNQLCDVCHIVAQLAENLLDHEVDPKHVEEAIKRECGALPKDLAEICENKVLPFINRIFEGLETHNSEQVCEHLEFC